MIKVIKMYLHGDKDSNYEKAEELGLSEKAIENFAYFGYEVEFDVELDTDTGDTKILTVDGHKVI
jgi:hypothetical protein